MKQLVKTSLIAILANLVFAGLFLIPFFVSGVAERGDYFFRWLLLHSLALLIQFVVALILIIQGKRRILGQGMLIASGIIVLIGLSVCGGLILFSY